MSETRNINLDYFRILCCIFVLCNHILSRYAYIEYPPNYFMLFLGTLNRMAVPGFFMITGFFLFRKEKKYSYILKKSLKLFIPTIIVIILLQVLEPFLLHEQSFMKSILNFKFNIIKTINCTLSFNSYESPNTAYLFFVFEYIQLLLLYPVFNLICKENETSKKVRKYLIFYTLITQLVIPNIFEFTNTYAVSLPQLIRIKFMYVLIGYEIYLKFKNKELGLHTKYYNIKCILIYLIMSLIQFILFCIKTNYFKFSYNEEIKFMTSESFTIFFSTVGLFLLFLNIDFSKVSNRVKNFASYISSHTYNIYLLHYAIMIYLFNSEFKNSLYQIYGISSSFLIVILCFTICLIISIILRFIFKLLRKILEVRSIYNVKKIKE